MSKLPTGWTYGVVGEINEFSGQSMDPRATPTTEFELYSVPTFSTGKPEILPGSAIGSTKQTVRPDDVLVCKINPRINRVWAVGPRRDRPQIASSEWIGVRAPSFDSRYLRYYFTSSAFRKEIEEGVTGVGGSLTRAQPKRVATFKVPIAPRREQGRIADKIQAVFAKVAACRDRLDRVPQLLKPFREAVLEAAISGKLTRKWRAERQLKDEWTTVALGSLVIGGPQNGLYKHRSSYGGGTKILRIDGFYNGEICDWDGLKRLALTRSEASAYRLAVGDIVINRVNSPPFVGKSALVRVLPEPCVFESNIMRITMDGSRIYPAYCARYLNSPTGLARLRANVKHAVNQSSINQQDVCSVVVPLPPLVEQYEIDRLVDQFFAVAESIEQRYQTAVIRVAKLMPAVLAKAFRGELVPQDPKNEPAEKLLERIQLKSKVGPTVTRAERRVKPAPARRSGHDRRRAPT